MDISCIPLHGFTIKSPLTPEMDAVEKVTEVAVRLRHFDSVISSSEKHTRIKFKLDLSFN